MIIALIVVVVVILLTNTNNSKGPDLLSLLVADGALDEFLEPLDVHLGILGVLLQVVVGLAGGLQALCDDFRVHRFGCVASLLELRDGRHQLRQELCKLGLVIVLTRRKTLQGLVQLVDGPFVDLLLDDVGVLSELLGEVRSLPERGSE